MDYDNKTKLGHDRKVMIHCGGKNAMRQALHDIATYEPKIRPQSYKITENHKSSLDYYSIGAKHIMMSPVKFKKFLLIQP